MISGRFEKKKRYWGCTVKDYFRIDISFGIISRRVILRWNIKPGTFFAAACVIDLSWGTASVGKKSDADVDDGFAMAKHAHLHVLVSLDYPVGQQLER